jgi:hypothetical protein
MSSYPYSGSVAVELLKRTIVREIVWLRPVLPTGCRSLLRMFQWRIAQPIVEVPGPANGACDRCGAVLCECVSELELRALM